MWSKTATFVCLSLIISGTLTLSGVEALAATLSPSIQRAERLSVLLIRQGYLKDNILVWKGVEYDVSKNYSLCDAYEGICYKAVEAGFSEPVMLAVYEIGPEQLDIMAIDYLKYKKDLSADSLKYYAAKDGKTENQVFAMQTAEGERMYDALGQLTRAGEKEFNAAIFADAGAPKKVAAAPGAKAPAGKTQANAKAPGTKKGKAAKQKGKANSAFSRYSVKQLGYMGYKEIFSAELDCLHEIPIDDKELIMEKIQDGGRVRWFLHPNDPAIMIAMKYRKEKVCQPFGSVSD